MIGTRMLAGAAFLAFVSSALADNVAGTCEPGKVKYLGNNDIRQTGSANYVNVPSTLVNFTQGGTKPSCVIVYFSAQVSTAANTVMLVRATLDGDPGAVPAETQFIAAPVQNWPANPQMHAGSFIFSDVAPGDHAVRMQYRSYCTGCGISMQLSNVIVSYSP